VCGKYKTFSAGEARHLLPKPIDLPKRDPEPDVQEGRGYNTWNTVSERWVERQGERGEPEYPERYTKLAEDNNKTRGEEEGGHDEEEVQSHAGRDKNKMKKRKKCVIL
jgi:hypothetical protein